jgi:cation diffusion facilitator CzcD-associated flavoprotein CzcO
MRPGDPTPNDEDADLDAVIVGAGFAGMYMLHQLLRRGFRARILEAGAGVGGVWYWNRYPGARCDIPVLNYSYSFSREIRAEWKWSERYAAQPEIERYANFVADRLGLRDHIRFDSSVTAAKYDEARRSWTLHTADGMRVSARNCIMATGGFSAPVRPDIAGLDDFAGEVVYTSRWPPSGVDVVGKRVGVLGTGSSGVQTVTALGRAGGFDRLTVFQRTPNYTAPTHNGPLDPQVAAEIEARFDEYWATVLGTGTGTFNEGPEGPIAPMTDDEFENRMEQAWQVGGPSTLLGVTDLLTDLTANRRVGEYLRRRVRERVADPETAESLCAYSFVGARRTVYENGYFEVYNDPRVQLVDLRKEPLVRATPEGFETTERLHRLDLLILATGFDSATGALLAIDIVGRDGRSLRDHWSDGPRTYVGLATSGFPNMFMIAGPLSPSIRSNVLVSIEHDVEWIADLLEHARDRGIEEVEAGSDAETAWTTHVAEVADATLVTSEDTQYIGANVAGKPRVFLAYIGGVPMFRSICAQIARAGYTGFALRDRAGSSRVVDTWSGPPRLQDEQLRDVQAL